MELVNEYMKAFINYPKLSFERAQNQIHQQKDIEYLLTDLSLLKHQGNYNNFIPKNVKTSWIKSVLWEYSCDKEYIEEFYNRKN